MEHQAYPIGVELDSELQNVESIPLSQVGEGAESLLMMEMSDELMPLDVGSVERPAVPKGADDLVAYYEKQLAATQLVQHRLQRQYMQLAEEKASLEECLHVQTAALQQQLFVVHGKAEQASQEARRGQMQAQVARRTVEEVVNAVTSLAELLDDSGDLKQLSRGFRDLAQSTQRTYQAVTNAQDNAQLLLALQLEIKEACFVSPLLMSSSPRAVDQSDDLTAMRALQEEADRLQRELEVSRNRERELDGEVRAAHVLFSGLEAEVVNLQHHNAQATAKLQLSHEELVAARAQLVAAQLELQGSYPAPADSLAQGLMKLDEHLVSIREFLERLSMPQDPIDPPHTGATQQAVLWMDTDYGDMEMAHLRELVTALQLQLQTKDEEIKAARYASVFLRERVESQLGQLSPRLFAQKSASAFSEMSREDKACEPHGVSPGPSQTFSCMLAARSQALQASGGDIGGLSTVQVALIAAEREVLSLRSQLAHRQQHIKLLEQRLLEQSQDVAAMLNRGDTTFASPVGSRKASFVDRRPLAAGTEVLRPQRAWDFNGVDLSVVSGNLAEQLRPQDPFTHGSSPGAARGTQMPLGEDEESVASGIKTPGQISQTDPGIAQEVSDVQNLEAALAEREKIISELQDQVDMYRSAWAAAINGVQASSVLRNERQGVTSDDAFAAMGNGSGQCMPQSPSTDRVYDVNRQLHEAAQKLESTQAKLASTAADMSNLQALVEAQNATVSVTSGLNRFGLASGPTAAVAGTQVASSLEGSKEKLVEAEAQLGDVIKVIQMSQEQLQGIQESPRTNGGVVTYCNGFDLQTSPSSPGFGSCNQPQLQGQGGGLTSSSTPPGAQRLATSARNERGMHTYTPSLVMNPTFFKDVAFMENTSTHTSDGHMVSPRIMDGKVSSEAGDGHGVQHVASPPTVHCNLLFDDDANTDAEMACAWGFSKGTASEDVVRVQLTFGQQVEANTASSPSTAVELMEAQRKLAEAHGLLHANHQEIKELNKQLQRARDDCAKAELLAAAAADREYDLVTRTETHMRELLAEVINARVYVEDLATAHVETRQSMLDISSDFEQVQEQVKQVQAAKDKAQKDVERLTVACEQAKTREAELQQALQVAEGSRFGSEQANEEVQATPGGIERSPGKDTWSVTLNFKEALLAGAAKSAVLAVQSVGDVQTSPSGKLRTMSSTDSSKGPSSDGQPGVTTRLAESTPVSRLEAEVSNSMLSPTMSGQQLGLQLLQPVQSDTVSSSTPVPTPRSPRTPLGEAEQAIGVQAQPDASSASSVETTIEELRAETRRLKQICVDQKSELQSLWQLHSRSKAEVVTASEQLEAAKAAKLAAQASADELRVLLQEQENLLVTLKAEAQVGDALSGKVVSLSKERDSLAQQLEEERAGQAELRIQLLDIEARLADAEARLMNAGVAHEATHTQAELGPSALTVNDLERQLAEALSEVQQSDRYMRDIEARLADAEAKLMQAGVAQVSAQTQYELQAEHAQPYQQHKDIDALQELYRVTKSVTEARTTAGDLLASNARLEKRLAEAAAGVATLSAVRNKSSDGAPNVLAQRLAGVVEELNAVAVSKAAMELELEAATDAKAKTEQQLADTVLALAQADAKLLAPSDARQQQHLGASDANRKLVVSQATVDLLAAKVAAAEASNFDLQERCMAGERICAELQRELDEKRIELLKAEKRLEASHAAMKTLTEELVGPKTSHVRLQEQTVAMENSGATNEKAAKLWGLSAANAARAEGHAAYAPGAYTELRSQEVKSELEKQFLEREALLEQELATLKTRVSELQAHVDALQQSRDTTQPSQESTTHHSAGRDAPTVVGISSEVLLELNSALQQLRKHHELNVETASLEARLTDAEAALKGDEVLLTSLMQRLNSELAEVEQRWMQRFDSVLAEAERRASSQYEAQLQSAQQVARTLQAELDAIKQTMHNVSGRVTNFTMPDLSGELAAAGGGAIAGAVAGLMTVLLQRASTSQEESAANAARAAALTEALSGAQEQLAEHAARTEAARKEVELLQKRLQEVEANLEWEQASRNAFVAETEVLNERVAELQVNANDLCLNVTASEWSARAFTRDAAEASAVSKRLQMDLINARGELHSQRQLIHEKAAEVATLVDMLAAAEAALADEQANRASLLQHRDRELAEAKHRVSYFETELQAAQQDVRVLREELDAVLRVLHDGHSGDTGRVYSTPGIASTDEQTSPQGPAGTDSGTVADAVAALKAALLQRLSTYQEESAANAARAAALSEALSGAQEELAKQTARAEAEHMESVLRVERLQEKEADLERELAGLEALKKVVAMLQASLEELRAQFGSSEERAEKLARDAAEASAVSERLRVELSDSREQLHSQRQLTDEKSAEAISLTAKLAAAEAKLADERANWASLLQNRDHELAETKQRASSMKAELQTAQQDVWVLREELDAVLRVLHDDHNRYLAQAHTTRATDEQPSGAAPVGQSAVTDRGKVLHVVTAVKDDFIRRISTHEQEAVANAARAAALAEALSSAQEELAKQAALVGAQQQESVLRANLLREKEADLEREKAAMASLKGVVAKLQANLEDLRSQHAASEKKAEAAARDVKEASAVSERLKVDLASLTAKLAAAEATLADERSKQASLLQQCDREVAEANQRVTFFEIELHAAQQDVRVLREELDAVLQMLRDGHSGYLAQAQTARAADEQTTDAPSGPAATDSGTVLEAVASLKADFLQRISTYEQEAAANAARAAELAEALSSAKEQLAKQAARAEAEHMESELLRKKLVEKETELRRQQAAVGSIGREVHALEHRVSELLGHVENAKDFALRVSSQFDDHKLVARKEHEEVAAAREAALRSAEELRLELGNTREALLAANNDLQAHRSRVAAVEVELANVESKMAQLQHAIATSEAQAEELRAELSAVQCDLEDARDERDDAIRQLSEAREDAVAKCSDYKQQLLCLRSEIEASGLRHEVHARQLMEAVAEAAMTRASYDEAMGQLDRAKRDFEAARQQLDELQIGLVETQRELTAAEQQLGEAQGAVTMAEEARTAMAAELVDTRARLSSAMSRCAALETDLVAKEGDLQQVKAALTVSESAAEARLSELAEARKRIHAASAESYDRASKLAKAESGLAAATASIISAKEEYEAKCKELTATQELHREAIAERDAVAVKLRKAEAELSATEMLLASVQGTAAEMRSELDASVKNLEVAITDRETLRNELCQVHEQAAKALNDLTETRTQRDAAVQQLDAVREVLAAIEDKHSSSTLAAAATAAVAREQQRSLEAQQRSLDASRATEAARVANHLRALERRADDLTRYAEDLQRRLNSAEAHLSSEHAEAEVVRTRLELHLAAARAELEATAAERTSALQQLAAVRTELADATSRRAALEAQVFSHEQRADVLQQQLEATRQQLAEAAGMAASELTQVETSNIKKEEQLATLRADLASAHSELVALAAQRDALQAQLAIVIPTLSATQAEREAGARQLSTLKDNQALLEGHLGPLELQALTLEQHVEELQRQLVEAEARHTVERADAAQLEARLAEAHAEIATLVAAREAAMQEVQQLQNKQSAAASTCGMLEAQLRDLQRHVDELQQQVESLHRDLADTETRLAAERTEVRSARMQAANVRAEMAAVMAERDATADQITLLISERDVLQRQHAATVQAKAALEEHVRALKDDVAQLQQEQLVMASLRDKLEDMDHTLVSERNAHSVTQNNLESELIATKAELAAAMSNNAVVQQQVSSVHEELAALRRELAAATKELGNQQFVTETRVGEMQVKVAQARAEMSAANERARELEAQLQDVTGALAVAEQQLHHRDTDAKAAVMELEAALEESREALENERACGDQKAKELQEHLEAAEAYAAEQLQKAQGEVSAARAALQMAEAEAAAEIASLKEELATVRVSLQKAEETATSRFAALQAINKAYNDVADASNQRVVELEAQMAAAHDAEADARRTLQDIRVTTYQQEEEANLRISALEADLAAAQNIISTWDVQRKQAEVAHRALEEKLAAERQRTSKMEPHIAALTAEVAELKAQIAQLNARIVELEDELANARDALARHEALQTELGSARDALARYEAYTVDAEAEIKELRDAASSSAEENARLQQQLEQLVEQLHRQTQQLSMAHDDAEQLRQEVAAINGFTGRRTVDGSVGHSSDRRPVSTGRAAGAARTASGGILGDTQQMLILRKSISQQGGAVRTSFPGNTASRSNTSNADSATRQRSTEAQSSAGGPTAGATGGGSLGPSGTGRSGQAAGRSRQPSPAALLQQRLADEAAQLRWEVVADSSRVRELQEKRTGGAFLTRAEVAEMELLTARLGAHHARISAIMDTVKQAQGQQQRHSGSGAPYKVISVHAEAAVVIDAQDDIRRLAAAQTALVATRQGTLDIQDAPHAAWQHPQHSVSSAAGQQRQPTAAQPRPPSHPPSPQGKAAKAQDAEAAAGTQSVTQTPTKRSQGLSKGDESGLTQAAKAFLTRLRFLDLECRAEPVELGNAASPSLATKAKHHTLRHVTPMGEVSGGESSCLSEESDGPTVSGCGSVSPNGHGPPYSACPSPVRSVKSTQIVNPWYPPGPNTSPSRSRHPSPASSVHARRGTVDMGPLVAGRSGAMSAHTTSSTDEVDVGGYDATSALSAVGRDRGTAGGGGGAAATTPTASRYRTPYLRMVQAIAEQSLGLVAGRQENTSKARQDSAAKAQRNKNAGQGQGASHTAAARQQVGGKTSRLASADLEAGPAHAGMPFGATLATGSGRGSPPAYLRSSAAGVGSRSPSHN